MHLKKKVSVFTVVVVAIVSLSIGVFADNAMIKIQGYIDKGMTLTYNEEILELTDAQDGTIYPVLIEGSTYLPVRAISEVVGLEVGWDGDTRTVSLTDAFETVIRKEENEEKMTETEKEKWNFAEALIPTDKFSQNAPSVEVVRNLYEALPMDQTMLKLEYTRVEEGEVLNVTNYLILSNEDLKDMLHSIYKGSVAVGVNREEIKGNIQRLTTQDTIESNEMRIKGEYVGALYRRITPEGVTSYTITNAWGDVVEGKE
jgi:hypothetical protein